MPRHRASILWLAAIFVVTGSAIGVAKVGDHTKKVSEVESSEAPELPEVEAEQEEGDQTGQGRSAPGERKENHGFFVSQAAHCEDVDDPATPESPDFAAPEDCSGSAHGKHVGAVAKSSLGKKAKND